MRRALRANPQRRPVSTGRSIPAPTGGWDAENSLADMPAKNAVILDNWIPRSEYVEMRRGYVEHVASLASSVETLLVWRGASSQKMLAATGTTIVDVTTAGAAGATLLTGASNARWQYVNFSNDAGQFVISVNGADTPQKYDGSAFADLTITGSSGAITLTASALVDVMAHKRRLFFVENGTLRVWYLDVEAIQGTAQLLDLGPVFSLGGQIVAQASWSLDGGQGPDDFAVWITDQGQAAIYQGLDPSDANSWALVGVFQLGLPLGRRSLISYGSDLVVLTTDGIMPMSQALKLNRAQGNLVSLTQRIRNAFATATRDYHSNFGWQGLLYPRGGLAIFNVPTVNLTESVQFVQNVQTGAWCRFTNIDAFCWAVFNGKPYFGGDQAVYEFDTGCMDNADSLIGDLKTAFNYFGERGRQKKFEMLRPILQSSQQITPAIALLTDFQEETPTANPTVTTTGGAPWGSIVWGAWVWSDNADIRYDWTGVTGLGYCGAVRVRTILQSASSPSPDVDVRLIGFDLMYQPGGIL